MPSTLLATDLVRLAGALFPHSVLQDYGYLLWPAIMLAVAGVVLLGPVTVYALIAIWMERKVSAFMQCRLGPNLVGPFGLIQAIADGIKLLAKEDLIPERADRLLFIAAPIIVFAGAFAAFAVVPWGPDLIPVDLDTGIVFIAAVGSIEAFGVILAGWASNNKWSLFGGLRAATQIVSYEIPLGVTLLAVVAIAGTFSIQDIVYGQAGGFWNWYLFKNPFMPVLFLILLITTLAECKRAPFDLPEAESELVSGFHTEYSAMRFSLFFLAEYAAMYMVSAVAAVAFLGGWWTGIPFLDERLAAGGVAGNAIGAVVIIAKSIFLVFVQMWLRWTLPRMRLDQMMQLCLKVLLPVSLVAFVAATLWELFLPGRAMFGLIGMAGLR